MRLVVAAAAVALSALPAGAGVPFPPSAIASPVSTQPLAAGEVLLEVNAVGSATTRADSATLTATVTARAATEAEARNTRDQLVQRVRAAARSAGAGEGDISVNYAPTATDLLGVGWTAEASEMVQPEARQEQVARSTIEVRISDVARTDQMRRALETAGAERVSDPNYSLSDNRAARRAARAEAIALARADAEAYAASLGMQVARIVRVTERVGFDFMTTFVSEPGFTRRMQNLGASRDLMVETNVIVGVDFALAPR